MAFNNPESVTVEGARLCESPTISVGLACSACASSGTFNLLSASSMLS